MILRDGMKVLIRHKRDCVDIPLFYPSDPDTCSFCGKIVTIYSVDNDCFKIKEQVTRMWWHVNSIKSIGNLGCLGRKK